MHPLLCLPGQSPLALRLRAEPRPARLAIPGAWAALLFLLAMTARVGAAQYGDFTYTSDGSAVTITAYTGADETVTIPGSIDGLPVTTIGIYAFYLCDSLTNATLPDTIVTIEAFAFSDCYSLISVTIPDRVASIGIYAFSYCTSLATATIGKGVTHIGDVAFWYCPTLTDINFRGDAPSLGQEVFDEDSFATVYYLPGTTGWGAAFGGRPTAPWHLPQPVILTLSPYFGLRTNHLCFRMSWATNASLVVEVSTNLAVSPWSPVATNTLVDGWSDFSDPYGSSHPARLYRLRTLTP